MLLYARHSWTICLSNVDPQANAIVLIPISAMMMMIITVLVLIFAPVVISITRLRLSDSSRHESRKDNGHYQQHSAVMPRYFIFHIRKIMDFMNPCNGVFTP